MLSSILQISGPIAVLALLFAYWFTGGRSPYVFAIAGAMEIHFIGDIIAGYLRPGVLMIAGQDLRQAFQPAYFMQWVGMGICLLSYAGRVHGHAGADYFFEIGFLMIGTGFVWGVIYNPAYKGPAS